MEKGAIILDGFSEMNLWNIILRSIFSFFAILVLARIIGKKQLGHLTFFHYITGITIGSIAAEISVQKDTPFWDGIISLVCWTLLTMLVSFIALKFEKIRVLVDDRPTIIIQNGTIVQSGLKKARLHTDEVAMLLREQGIFSFDDVLYAIFETNGELSVLKKPAKSPSTKQDVNADISIPPYMPTIVVSKGKINRQNLQELDLTEEWLMNKLKKKKIEDITQVYFAQVLENGSLYVSKHNESGNNP